MVEGGRSRFHSRKDSLQEMGMRLCKVAKVAKVIYQGFDDGQSGRTDGSFEFMRCTDARRRFRMYVEKP